MGTLLCYDWLIHPNARIKQHGRLVTSSLYSLSGGHGELGKPGEHDEHDAHDANNQDGYSGNDGALEIHHNSVQDLRDEIPKHSP